jgi:hypothetical protein
MTTPELRPMGIGDILDATFRLYRQRFLTFLLVGLVVYVPYALLLALFQTAGMTQGERAVAPGGQVDMARVVFQVVTFAVFLIILLPLCGAAMVHNISASYLGESLTAGESYSRAAPRLFRLLGAQILAGLCIFVGFLLLIVPGVIFSLWFLLVAPVVVLEGIGGSAALGRSRELMRGNLGKGFLLALVVGILTAIIGGVFGALTALVPWPHPAFETFFDNVLSALLLPIQTAPTILLYYDLRIRKEAFDLQKLAEALGRPAAT